MMAEVMLPPSQLAGQMEVGYCWAAAPPPDERDAYIGWLKSEFAAANALIDSMCHHMHNIGRPGEYDLVFGCLNRRRHAWTPSLYMQHFFSVAEVATALQEVAWKKHHSSSMVANAAPTGNCPSADGAQLQADHHEEAHDKAQLMMGSYRRSNTHLNLTANSDIAEPQHNEQVRIECFSTSNKDDVLNGSHHVKATPELEEAGEVEISHSPKYSAFSTSAESTTTECDKNTSHEAGSTSSTSHICNTTSGALANNTKGHIGDQSNLDVKKLLNAEVSIASKEDDARQAMIKRSIQFQCCEYVDGQKVNDGESVELCESVLNRKEVDEIIEIICQLQAAGRQGELGCAFRGRNKSSRLPEIIQFGPKLRDETKMNDYSQCIPKFLQAIIRWLTSCGILSPKRRPDSCLISIFDEGNFEAPNTDQGAWEKPLCVISLMEDCTMVFGHSITTDQYGSCKGSFQVALPAGSVLLLRENFSGILQKAIPASTSRRITIALGKAVSSSSSIAELNCVIATGKMKNHKQRGKGGEKQARLPRPPNSGVRSHPLSHMMQFPFPSMQPNLAGGFMLPAVHVLPRGTRAGAGTGVFFPAPPCTDTWQSGSLLLFSSTTATSLVHSKRAEKHAGSLAPINMGNSQDVVDDSQSLRSLHWPPL